MRLQGDKIFVRKQPAKRSFAPSATNGRIILSRSWHDRLKTKKKKKKKKAKNFRSHAALWRAFQNKPQNLRNVTALLCEGVMTSTSPKFRALMVSAERRASTEYQAGRDVLRVVHLSQPITWALLWNTAVNNFLQDPKSLSFFLSLSLFSYSLCRTNRRVLVTISTAVEKAKRWNTAVVSVFVLPRKVCKTALRTWH